MALAGKSVVVRSADSDVAGDVVGGAVSIDWGPVADLLDTTDFGSSGWRERIQGLKDLSVTISGDYESADAGQARLYSRWSDGAACWIRFLPDGSAGFKASCLVASFSITAAHDGKVEFSASLQLGASTIGTV